MKGYTVHLLFHLLALLTGGAGGVAAGFWLFAGDRSALWVLVAAVFAGIAVLGVQLFYLRDRRAASHTPSGASVRSSPRIDVHNPERAEHREAVARTRVQDYGHHDEGPRRTTVTRPDLQPVEDDTGARESTGSEAAPAGDDEETSVAAAFERRRRADPTMRRW